MWRGPTALARLATGVSAMVVVVVLALIPPSPFCIPLKVAASNEKSALLVVLADEYEKGRPVVNGRCVDVQIFKVASGEAEAALARGVGSGFRWRAGARRVVTGGPDSALLARSGRLFVEKRGNAREVIAALYDALAA
jgi:hypothetical protein